MRRFLTSPLAIMIGLILVVAVIAVAIRPRPQATPAPVPAAASAQPVAQQQGPAPVGPGGFVPLQSQAVKDAIHRALVTGATQRWQDGALGGYAVPSTTTGANGCRAIRYTIDQQPDAPYGSITACDASAPH